MKVRNIMVAALVAVFLISTGLYSQSKRMVLIEEATNASCGPCAAQNPAFKAWINENKDDIIPLIYHAWWPGTDVMYNKNTEDNQNRIQYYSVNGVPSARVNGQIAPIVNTSYYAGAPGDVQALTNEKNKYTGQTSPISIDFTQNVEGNKFTGSVTVTSTTALSNKVLHIAIAEQYHYYENAGSNGEKDFYYIMRKMYPTANGTNINIAAGGSQTFEVDYTIDPEFNKELMYLIAFVQDNSTKEVLQAGQIPFVSFPFENLGSKYKKGAPSSTVNTTFQVTNTRDVAYTVDFASEADLPNDWSVNTPTNVTIPANSTQEVSVDINIGNTPFYANVKIKVSAPNSPEQGTLFVENFATVNVLSTNVQNVVFYGTNAFVQAQVISLFNNLNYNANAAYLPIDPELFTAYPASDFNFIMFTCDYNNRGYMSHRDRGTIVNDIIAYIDNAVTNGGKVLLAGELEMYFINDPQAYNSSAYNLFNMKLGFQSTGQVLSVSQVQGNQIQLIPYTVYGKSGHDISNNMQFSMNVYNPTTNPYYSRFGDILQAKANSDAEVFMYFDEARTQGAAIRTQIGDAKIVYMGFGFEGFSNQNDRNQFFDKIVEWFEAGVQPEGPKISSTVSSISFGNTPAGEPQTRDFKVSNTGASDLTINTISIANDADGVFSIDSETGSLTVAPGNEITVVVRFAPTENKTYNATLRISSNAENTPNLEVSLSGSGTTKVDEDGFARITDLFSIKLSPNPISSNGTIQYEFHGNETMDANIAIYNASGKKVAVILENNIYPGSQNYNVNADLFTNGKYFVIANVGGKSVTLPFAIVK